jgi:hypothetical protein
MVVLLVSALSFGCDDQNASDYQLAPTVVGGTLDNGHPSVVALNPGCSGEIIAPEWALTAGHCVGIVTSMSWGTNARGSGNIAIVETVPHPDADIALVRLAQAVPAELVPVTINATDLQPMIGQDVILSGYGRGGTVDALGPGGTKLTARTRLTRLTDTQCCGSVAYVANFMSANACNGDSGGWGGIVMGGTEVFVGAISHGTRGRDCGNIDNLAGLVQTAPYVTWMKETVGGQTLRIYDGQTPSPPPGGMPSPPPGPSPGTPAPPQPAPGPQRTTGGGCSAAAADNAQQGGTLLLLIALAAMAGRATLKRRRVPAK